MSLIGKFSLISVIIFLQSFRFFIINKSFRHPLLMVAGFIFSFAWGLTSFRNPYLSKPINKILHVVFYVLAIICFSVGLKAVWKSHDQDSSAYKPNLYSLHSWLGLIAVLIFGQNFLFGFLHFLIPSTPIENRQSYMPYHIFFGTLSFISAVVAIETGKNSKRKRKKFLFISC